MGVDVKPNPVFPNLVPLGVIPDGPLIPGIRASIEKTLDEIIPSGKHAALLVCMDTKGPKVSFATRVDKHWVLTAEANVTWQGSVTGRLYIAATW